MDVRRDLSHTIRNIADSAVGRSIKSVLEQLRKALLDVGRRNRLINTPRQSKRSNVINIVDGEADAIFHVLLTVARPLTFVPLPEQEKPDGKSFESAKSPVSAPPNFAVQKYLRRSDTQLQTELSSEKLQKKLLSLHRDAKTLEEEQGINVLFFATGFLRWYENTNSDEPN